jgi:hydrogenase-4 component E
MSALLNALLVIVLLLNLFALGTSRISALIQGVAIQGIVLGVISVVVRGHVTLLTVLVGVATVLLKGGVIPHILRKALRDVQIKREVEPFIGFIPSMLLGALGTGVSLALATKLPLAPGDIQSLIVPTSFATVFTGFLLLVSRRKALTQAIGYLVLENGIFVFGMLLLEAMPFLVELGVLLDLFVAIFVISIIIHHIYAAFDSTDTSRLASLKE